MCDTASHVVAEPVIGIPGVGQSDLISDYAGELDIVVDEDLGDHILAVDFVVSVDPIQAGKAGIERGWSGEAKIGDYEGNYKKKEDGYACGMIGIVGRSYNILACTLGH
jgi:hypothetical protein